MVTIGIALIELKSTQLISMNLAGSATDYVAGILVCGLALLVVVYGLAVFLWRLRKLRRRDATGYSEPFGPVFLVAMLIFAVLIYVVIKVP